MFKTQTPPDENRHEGDHQTIGAKSHTHHIATITGPEPCLARMLALHFKTDREGLSGSEKIEKSLLDLSSIFPPASAAAIEINGQTYANPSLTTQLLPCVLFGRSPGHVRIFVETTTGAKHHAFYRLSQLFSNLAFKIDTTGVNSQNGKFTACETIRNGDVRRQVSILDTMDLLKNARTTIEEYEIPTQF